MTPEENEVMDHLVKAWNLFLDLPEQHSDDINEFRLNFHSLQRIILVRQLRDNQGD